MMKLRTRLNLVLAGLSGVLVIVLLVVQIQTSRASVSEEIGAANRVASQLLGRLAFVYSSAGGPALLLQFLEQLGRVRANDIILRSISGEVYYKSPPPTYKAGREAPEWFARMLTPPSSVHTFLLPGGVQLVVKSDASRAVLDGWDDFVRLLLVSAVMLIAINGLAFWSVGRALAPFPVIVEGLKRIQQGHLGFRLPPLPGYEASVMSSAFNGMAQGVEEKLHAERQALAAETRLEERREMARVVEQRLEEERRSIAHELHDEFSQSVTAIRSLAMAIASQGGMRDPRTGEAAKLISDEAGRLYDAMHGLIPRLMPLSLDTLGLADTLDSLVRDWQRRSPSTELLLTQNLQAALGTSVTLTLYRLVQEGLINALRHAQASRIEIEVQSDAERATVTISDDGVGLPEEWSRPGHFGLRGLAERVENLRGVFHVGNREPRGVILRAEIPLADSPGVSA